MKSFLCKGKRPIIKWSRLPNNTFFEGKLPEGYSLAVMPSENYVIVDVDKHGDIDGFNSIPIELEKELENTLHYKTNKDLANKASGVGIDLRVGNKGYVIWYPKKDIRDCLDEINETSLTMNKWLEKLFSYVDKK
jgi:hypothetical protein